MLQAGDDDGLVAVAQAQIAAGAGALDVHVGRDSGDEADVMIRVVRRLVGAVDVPLALDSTSADVIARALPCVPRGRAIINSVHLGAAAGMDRLLPLAREHGAAVVALCMDESGMARTRTRKLEIAQRLFDHIVGGGRVEPEALLIDPLTFPLATDGAGHMVETIEAVRLIKQHLPGVRTVLGISDVSFRLSGRARATLNAMFLEHCLHAGLDAAIMKV